MLPTAPPPLLYAPPASWPPDTWSAEAKAARDPTTLPLRPTDFMVYGFVHYAAFTLLEAVTAARVASRLELARATVVATLERLEAAGLVSRNRADWWIT
jgi:DNA-binding MarR family transcriptional regulator